MPYIKKEDRELYDDLVSIIVDTLMHRTCDETKQDTDAIKGHHNYIMFVLALEIANKLGIRYHTLQDIIGTFECCKNEFLRRVVDPYEDKAILKNGDIEGIELNQLPIPKVRGIPFNCNEIKKD
jgi:hypothetical protein